MKTSYRETIVRAAQEVLETMFFTFVEPLDPHDVLPETMPSGSYYHGQIELKDGQHGETLHVVIPAAMADSLTRALLAKDDGEPLTQDEVLDTVREIANMILGSVLRQTSAGTTHRPGIPKAQLTHGVPELNPRVRGERIAFDSDWGAMLLLVDGPDSDPGA